MRLAPDAPDSTADAAEAAEAADRPLLWFDGAIVDDASRPIVDPLAHTLHYGDGVFEGIRCYPTGDAGRALFRLREHLERLAASAAAYSLTMPFTLDEIAAAIVGLLKRSPLRAAYVRPLVFFGGGTMHIGAARVAPTHVLIIARPMPPTYGASPGIAVTVSPWRKVASSALPSTVKATGHYANSVLAIHDARARGFDDALLLNAAGNVAEATGANLFVVRDGVVATNDPSADILDGITRRSVIALAEHLGLPVAIRPLTGDDLERADELFLTGTALEIAPIARVDDHALPAERPVSEVLRQAFRAVVAGEHPLSAPWLTPVPSPTSLPAMRTRDPARGCARDPARG